MARLPVCRPKEVIRALEKAGFRIDHQTGSHVVLEKENHPYPVVVPRHTRDIKKGTLRHIIRSAGLTVEEFGQLL